MSIEQLTAEDKKLVYLVTSSLKTRTQKQLAKAMGWKEQKTVRSHLAKPEVNQAINDILDEKLNTLRPLAYKSLEYGLHNNERWATELLFKLNGEMVERRELTGQGGGAIKTETTVKDERLNEYTDEELDYILEAAKSRADISESGGGEATPE